MIGFITAVGYVIVVGLLLFGAVVVACSSGSCGGCNRPAPKNAIRPTPTLLPPPPRHPRNY